METIKEYQKRVASMGGKAKWANMSPEKLKELLTAQAEGRKRYYAKRRVEKELIKINQPNNNITDIKGEEIIDAINYITERIDNK